MDGRSQINPRAAKLMLMTCWGAVSWTELLTGGGVPCSDEPSLAPPPCRAHPPGFEPGRLHAGARPLYGVFPDRLWWHRLAHLWPCLVRKKKAGLGNADLAGIGWANGDGWCQRTDSWPSARSRSCWPST